MKHVVYQKNQPWIVFYLTNKGVGRESVGSGNLIKEITDNFLNTEEEVEILLERLSSPEAIKFFNGIIPTEVIEVKSWDHYVKIMGLRGKY